MLHVVKRLKKFVIIEKDYKKKKKEKKNRVSDRMNFVVI